ncbi:MAG TPA: ExeM/NucH family extracellular endonuclease [Roseiflexaceae bacterium]|nr:ExeM/NucH family extracellular endonuclease [Roseiflexaceae bacterium]
MSHVHRPVRFVLPRLALLCALLALLVLPTARPARADTTYQTLPFSQDWSSTGLITTNDDWSGVPGITGYRGDGLVGGTGVDPQTVLTEGTPVVDVNATQTNPVTFTTGGVTEFELTNPTIALAGSGTAAAPSIVLFLNTSGQTGISISYNVRDLDSSTDDATQQVALQYRVGASGNFTNVPVGFVADATEASAATKVTAVSATLPAAADNQSQVQVRIITTNAVGNDEPVGIDDISVTAGGGGGNAAIAPSCGGTLTTTVGTATNRAVSATDSDGTVVQAAITTTPVAGITLDSVTPAGAVGGTLNATLNVAGTVAQGSYTVEITFTNSDAPTPQTATCSVTVQVNPVGGVCPTTPANLKLIGAVQGTSETSPDLNGTVSVRGVVTGDFQGSNNANSGMNGFFIQDPTSDGNDATSDGIFVFVPTANSFSNVALNTGDLVQVSGTVKEFQGLTEIDTLTALDVCSSSNSVPAPIDIDLPAPSNTWLERYEGMLVRFPETLTAAQNYFQGRYGQVTLSAEGRLYNPTNGNGLGENLDLNLRRMVVLDDAYSGQNPNPIPYIGADSTLRAGDTTSNVVGLLDYGPINSNTDIRHYRVQPTVKPTFTRVNQRTPQPEAIAGNVKVVGFNVLNYFTTIDQSGAACFPGGTRSDCRGADSTQEFQRQQAKIVAALSAIDADVVGLIELENNGATAINNLVAALNAATTAGKYAVVPDPATGVGGDAIKVGLIYQPARVTRVGSSLSDTDPVHNRPPVAQTFALVSNGEKFSVVVNHFKSKGSCPSSASDPNADFGQGCWNVLRTEQAEQLLTFIDSIQTTSGDDDVLVVGDLNAYGAEDPIVALEEGGLVEQAKQFIAPADRYSYIFDGQSGELDHVLATESLSEQAVDMTIWHINADEPVVIDYNTEFKPQDLYSATPYRSSDHDPAIIGLQLQAAPLAPASFAGSSLTVNQTTVSPGGVLTYTLTISNSGQVGSTFSVTNTLPAGVTVLSAPGLTVNGNTVSLNGAVGAGEQQTFLITVRVAPSAAGTTLGSQASLSGDGQTRTLNAPVVSVSATPSQPNFAGSSLTVNKTSASVGEVLTYTLTISNSGQVASTFSVTDTLPAGLTVLSAPGLIIDSNKVYLFDSAIGAGEQRTFTITVRVEASAASSTLNNQASLSGDGQTRTLNAPNVTVAAVDTTKKIFLPITLR